MPLNGRGHCARWVGGKPLERDDVLREEVWGTCDRAGRRRGGGTRHAGGPVISHETIYRTDNWRARRTTAMRNYLPRGQGVEGNGDPIGADGRSSLRHCQRPLAELHGQAARRPPKRLADALWQTAGGTRACIAARQLPATRRQSPSASAMHDDRHSSCEPPHTRRHPDLLRRALLGRKEALRMPAHGASAAVQDRPGRRARTGFAKTPGEYNCATRPANADYQSSRSISPSVA